MTIHATQLNGNTNPLIPNADRTILESTARDGIRAPLELMGEDPARAGITDTPARVVKAYMELASQPGDPADLLSVQFDGVDYADQLVAVGPVPFTSICEHHLLPFTGTAWIAYLPADGRVVGLSKLPRLLDHYAKRPQVQERLTNQVTAALNKYLAPTGAACVVRSTHQCMSLRGVEKTGAAMVTSSLTGAFRLNPELRSEFLALTRGA